MANLAVNLVLAVLVRLLFVAFMLMLGVWGGLEVVGDGVNVIEFTQDAFGAFREVGDILNGR